MQHYNERRAVAPSGPSGIVSGAESNSPLLLCDNYWKYRPPLMFSVAPVMKPARSEER